MQEEHGIHLPSSKFLQQTGEKSIFIVKSLVHFNLTQQSQNFSYVRALLYTPLKNLGEKCNFGKSTCLPQTQRQHFFKFVFHSAGLKGAKSAENISKIVDFII